MPTTLLKDVVAAVDDQWRGAAEINERMGVWAPVSTKRTLNILFTLGAVEKSGRGDCHHIPLYRRKT